MRQFIRLIPCVAAMLLATAAIGGEQDLVYSQTQEAIAEGEFDQALALMDKALETSPREAKYRGLRGVAWLGKGDYAKGAADLRAAVELNAGDAGNEKPPQDAQVKLSPAALEHGRRQVERMLRDRPAMAKHAKEAEFLRDWAARKFAGEDFGELIDWDPSPPLHSDAEHIAPTDHAHAAILVAAEYDEGPKEGQPRSFEELWAGAVYELYNVFYSRRFIELNKLADEGTITKDEFVGGILRLELRAAQQTRAFYLRHYLPWTEKQKLPTNATLWFCDWWDRPETVLQSFTDHAAYPWRPYGRTYDWAAVHRLWSGGKNEEAIKVLKGMFEEEGYEEDDADVMYWIGRCRMRLDQPAEAVKAFSEAIRLEPDFAGAYRARGEAHEKLGAKDKAKADFAKADELSR
jgi:tetratricopeptide (TPR) repeat protein